MPVDLSAEDHHMSDSNEMLNEMDKESERTDDNLANGVPETFSDQVAESVELSAEMNSDNKPEKMYEQVTNETTDEVCDGPEYSYKVVDENHNILDSGTRSVSVGLDIPIPLYVHKPNSYQSLILKKIISVTMIMKMNNLMKTCLKRKWATGNGWKKQKKHMVNSALSC